MSTSRFHEQKSLSRTNSGCFDCNICLDYVCEPVVTLCGHLYCWSCIYKWLHTQTNEHPTCPVCKNDISDTTLIPLYGRGRSPGHRPKVPVLGMHIPPRPKVFGTTQIVGPNSQNSQQLPHRNQNYLDDYVSNRLNGNTGTGFLHPVVVMFGELFCARISQNGSLNSYNLMGSGNNPRLRRQEMLADKSLNRISIFLFCCFLLCLLLF